MKREREGLNNYFKGSEAPQKKQNNFKAFGQFNLTTVPSLVDR